MGILSKATESHVEQGGAYKWALPLSACSWRKLEIADVCGGDMRGGENQTKKQFPNQARGSKESLCLSSGIHRQFQPLSGHDLSKFFGRVSPAIATVLVMRKAVSPAVAGAAWQHWRSRSRNGQRGERGDVGKALRDSKVV